MQHFSPSLHQPHPPGYFLYVCLGRLLNGWVHDANLALVLLSILASCGVVVLIYRMAMEWFGLSAARFAALLFLFSPLAWFHGTVALTYSVEAFFSAFMGYLCWRVFTGNVAWIVPMSLIFGIAAGVRPSSLLLLAPLFAYTLSKLTFKQSLTALATLVATVAAWFFPMIRTSGGWDVYFGALRSLWRMVPSRDTVFNSSPATSIARACTIVFIYSLCLGVASIVPLFRRKAISKLDHSLKIFTAVWVAPALCFFTFIFLKFVNSGYLLLLAAPACMWLGFWTSQWYQSSSWRKPLKVATIALGAAANTAIYLAAPLYCSYASVRHFESDLNEIRAVLPEVSSSNDTLIVGFDSHFLGYRHAGYYLPEYQTIEYPSLDLQQGVRIFSMQGRDTRLLSALPLAGYTRFVIFPLPGGDAAYEQHLQAVVDKLPRQGLKTLRVEHHTYVTGAIADLPLLFPDVPHTSALLMYAPLHAVLPYVNIRTHSGHAQSP